MGGAVWKEVYRKRQKNRWQENVLERRLESTKDRISSDVSTPNSLLHSFSLPPDHGAFARPSTSLRIRGPAVAKSLTRIPLGQHGCVLVCLLTSGYRIRGCCFQGVRRLQLQKCLDVGTHASWNLVSTCLRPSRHRAVQRPWFLGIARLRD